MDNSQSQSQAVQKAFTEVSPNQAKDIQLMPKQAAKPPYGVSSSAASHGRPNQRQNNRKKNHHQQQKQYRSPPNGWSGKSYARKGDRWNDPNKENSASKAQACHGRHDTGDGSMIKYGSHGGGHAGGKSGAGDAGGVGGDSQPWIDYQATEPTTQVKNSPNHSHFQQPRPGNSRQHPYSQKASPNSQHQVIANGHSQHWKKPHHANQNHHPYGGNKANNNHRLPNSANTSRQGSNQQKDHDNTPWSYQQDFGLRLPESHYLIQNHKKNKRQQHFNIKSNRINMKYQKKHIQPQFDLVDWFRQVQTSLKETHEKLKLTDQKQNAYQKLNEIVDSYFWWQYQLKNTIERSFFKLAKFGSAYLQTDDFESDIDVVLCTYADYNSYVENFEGAKIRMNFLDHENGTFFNSFYGYLQKASEISDLQKIEEAQVPLIKLKIFNVEIDLLLCAKYASAKDLCDSEETVSKKSLNSIQGLECTLTLEKIANGLLHPPQYADAAAFGCAARGLYIFQEVVKMLKYFSKQKSIYGANLCYFNGMTIQIMTIYVMELIYEQHNVNRSKEFLQQFDINEVNEIPYASENEQIQYIFESWFKVFTYLLDSKPKQQDQSQSSGISGACASPSPNIQLNYALGLYGGGASSVSSQMPLFMDDDGQSKLSVFTPIEPSRNSSINVTGSNFHAIYNEIKRGYQMFNYRKIGLLSYYDSQAFPVGQTSNQHFFDILFKQQFIPMESDHRYLLQMTIKNKDPAFIGLFDSRIKVLREKIENQYIQLQNDQRKYVEQQGTANDKKKKGAIRRYNADNYISVQSSNLSELERIPINFEDAEHTRNNHGFNQNQNNYDSTGGTDACEMFHQPSSCISGLSGELSASCSRYSENLQTSTFQSHVQNPEVPILVKGLIKEQEEQKQAVTKPDPQQLLRQEATEIPLKFQPENMLSEPLAPVLIKKYSSSKEQEQQYFVSLPFTNSFLGFDAAAHAGWHNSNIFRIITQWHQDSLYKFDEEYEGKENLEYKYIKFEELMGQLQL